MAPSPALPNIPVIRLERDRESRYLGRIIAAIQAARLNAMYPDPARLVSHLQALGLHGGLYPGLEIDVRSGLPSYREWMRVRTDAAVAASVLAELPPDDEVERRAAADPGSIHGLRYLKRVYYGALVGRPLAPLNNMDVALRRVDAAERTAWFHVVLDKLDGSGTFVRYSVDIGQCDGVWTRPMVTLKAETASATEALRSLVFRFTTYDAEFAHAALSAEPGITVERVVKATVGPFVLSEPPTAIHLELASLVAGRPGAMIATFATDTAAQDLATDRNNDPMGRTLLDSLSPEARKVYEEARYQHGFHTFRDRKFVVSPGVETALAEWCGTAGTRNVVYVLRDA